MCVISYSGLHEECDISFIVLPIICGLFSAKFNCVKIAKSAYIGDEWICYSVTMYWNALLTLCAMEFLYNYPNTWVNNDIVLCICKHTLLHELKFLMAYSFKQNLLYDFDFHILKYKRLEIHVWHVYATGTRYYEIQSLSNHIYNKYKLDHIHVPWYDFVINPLFWNGCHLCCIYSNSMKLGR